LACPGSSRRPVIVETNHAHPAIAFQEAFLHAANVFDPLLAQLLQQVVFGDQLRSKISVQDPAIPDQRPAFAESGKRLRRNPRGLARRGAWPVCHTDVVALAKGRLFGVDLPDGFRYRAEFLTCEEERTIADEVARVQFSTFEMRGVAARRRVAFFGRSYDEHTRVIEEIPPFLLALRARVAAWASVEPEAFAMALINEYSPGAPIGWHRDAPPYGVVAGLSLLSPCRMKFRPYRAAASRGPERIKRLATHEIVLEPRSAYLMTGPARSAYEHHIPVVTALRYSMTFRTLRAGDGSG
jgi:alkylated DNA repair dioxygenase AlkB